MCSPYPKCPNETDYATWIPAWEFEEDSDIAGTGVITSFLVYAILTNTIAFYAYFVTAEIVPNDYYNNLDELLSTKTRSLFKYTKKRCITPLLDLLSRYVPVSFGPLYHRFWHSRFRGIRADRLQSICLQLADMQLITGASILIVLYSTHCTITQYHFYIGSQLAYLSFVTFQAIFMTVRDHLQGSLLKRLWRYLWIVVLFGAITFSRVVTRNNYFLVWRLYGASVQCALEKINDGWNTESLVYLVVDCFLLFWSFYTITVNLFPGTRKLPIVSHVYTGLHTVVAWLFRCLFRRLLSDSSARKKLIQRFIFGILITLKQLALSEAFNLLRTYVMLTYAVETVLFERAEAANQGRQGDENGWGFGQVLPVLLLAIPLCQFVEEFCRTEHAPSTKSNFPARQWFSSTPTLTDHDPESHEPAPDSNGAEISRVTSGSDAQSLTAKDELDDRIEELELELFENSWFQVWIVSLFFSLFSLTTWASYELGLPI